MGAGDKIEVRVNGVRLTMVLDERVEYEPACYHTDPGWWAVGDGEVAYFISDDGRVYGQTETSEGQLTAWSEFIGRVIA